MSMGEIKFELGDRVYSTFDFKILSKYTMGTIIKIEIKKSYCPYIVLWDGSGIVQGMPGSDLRLDQEYAFYKDILKL